MASSGNLVLAEIGIAQYLGVLDDNITHCYGLKQYQDDPQFFLNLLLAFVNDAPASISRIEVTLTQNVIDFKDLDEDAIKLRGCSSSAGAFKIANACTDLRLAAEKRSKDGCKQALDVLKREFANVRPHADTIILLEREDILHENKRRG